MSTRDAVRGNRLSDADVRDLLTEVGHGVLALPGDGPPYPLPMSFGFDGSDRLYVLFAAASDEGRKLTHASAADRASFLAYEVTGDGWRSALVAGPFGRVRGKEAWDRGRAAMADNAWRPDLFGDDGASADRDPRMWVLRVTELGGRTVGTP